MTSIDLAAIIFGIAVPAVAVGTFGICIVLKALFDRGPFA